jgi:hypothetical protein
MNREKFSEDAYLYLLNELNQEDKTEFENILMQDDLLNREFQIIRNQFALIARSKPKEVDDKTLTSARNSLMRQLKKEAEKTSFFGKLINDIKNFFYHNYGLAFGGVATFALGIGIGYALLVTRNIEPNLRLNKPIEITGTEPQTSEPATQESVAPENSQSNVKQEPANNSVNESRIGVQPNLKESLINSLLAGPNPGIRIRSISKISDESQTQSFKPDPKIKNALISAMMKDKNPVVRREALNVLGRYSFDSQVRDALLYVLSNDENSGMRVAAINALTDLRDRGIKIDPIIKQTLTQKSMTDNNTFVKIRAASILKEVE